MAVRIEKVVLSASGNLPDFMVRAAAATELLDGNLEHLDGSASRSQIALQRAGRGVTQFGSQSRAAAVDLNTFTGRLGALSTAALAIGPAFVPLASAGVPALASLTAGLAGAVGVAAAAGLAFAGVGDALDALNTFQLEPSADNFLQLQAAMDELGPSGENLVRHLDSIGGEIEALQQIAGDNAFPGVIAGLDEILELTPRAQAMVAEFASRLGRLAADSGASLAGEEWEGFFTFLQTDAGPIFEQFARAAGNVALGLANMSVAFAPLSRDFARGMLEASRSFAAWTADSDNFTEFIDYVRSVGPQVSDFLGSLAEAAVALTEAVAPWGSVVLPAMTVLLDLFTAVAGSPIGPALTTAALAMLTFNKAAAAGTAVMGRVAPAVGGMRSSLGQMRADLGTVATTWATAGAATERESKKMAAATGRLKTNMATIGKGAGAIGAIGVAASGAAQGVGLQNTAMLGLAGTMAGPWGAAAGAGVGLILDFQAAQDGAAAAARSFADTLDTQTGALTDNSTAWIENQLSNKQLQAIHDAGLNLDEVTAALASGAEGWDTYFTSLSASEQESFLQGEGFLGTVAGNLYEVARAAGEGTTRFDLLAPSVNGAAGSAANAAESINELAAAQMAQTQASLAGIDAGTRYGAALAAAAAQADSAQQGFNRFTEAGRANRDAMSQLVAAYNSQDTATKNSVKGYRDATREVAELGRGMGLTSEQIRTLQGYLEKPAKLQVQTAEAQAAIREAKAGFESLPPRLQTEVQTKGVPTTMAQIDELVRKYGLTEKQRTALVRLKDNASGPIGQVLRELLNLDGKTATTTTTNNVITNHIMRTVDQTNAINRERANGGFQENGRLAFADGGYGSNGRYYSRTAQIIPGGANILWGEKETGWEAYISGKPSERERNLQILSMAADRLGAAVTPFANGGIPSRDPVAAALWQSGHRDPNAALIAGLTVRQLARLGRAFDDLSGRRLSRLGRAMERAADLQEKQTERARDRFEKVRDRRNEFGSSIADGLRGDLWSDAGGSAFGKQFASGSIGAVNAQLRAERDQAKQFSKDIALLRKKGLNGAALEEIIATGDADRARMFASGSVSALRSYEAAYNARQSATAAAGRLGGAVLTPEYNALKAELGRQVAQQQATNQKLDLLRKEQDRRHSAAQKSREDNGAGPAARRGARGRR